MARLDQSPKTVSIVDLIHDGRGVARWPEGHAQAGKTVFVSGALTGETGRLQAALSDVEAAALAAGLTGALASVGIDIA